MEARRAGNGGRRPGAGRPRTGRKPRCMIAISPRCKLMIKAYAASRGCTLMHAADMAAIALRTHQ